MTADRHRVRVLVVDDSAESRSAIAAAVAHTSGFECVGAVGSGPEAIDALPRLEPELVLLDVRMDGLSGVETCRLIRSSGSAAAVVLVSVLRSSQLPDGVASCGAAAFLHKSEVSPRALAALWGRLQSDPSAALADGDDRPDRNGHEAASEAA
jgi:two-component system invasion response regulator UvrY